MRTWDELREQYLPRLETYFDTALSRLGEEHANARMAAYHLATGGKRLRALIPLYVYEALGHDPAEAIPLGAAVEMIHNATLVHDDLQDGDQVRRGKPTVWKKFGAVQAINCGDAMFQIAYGMLAELQLEPARLVRLMSHAFSATLDVIEGQAQEFRMKEEEFPGVERYLGVIRGKTSGLFSLPFVGAMEALGLEERLCRAAAGAATDLGMLFQIQDDLLDIYGRKGRDRFATDIAEGKISFLVAHTNEVAGEADKRELAAILRKERPATTDADVRRAMAIFDRAGAREAALRRIDELRAGHAQSSELNSRPEIRRVLDELGVLFLAPIREIVAQM